MDNVVSKQQVCSLCHSPITIEEKTTICPGCQIIYHKECWDEIGGCGVYGCKNVPETDKRTDLEIPASFWGRETKPCPSCGQEIQAMAVRCRHCKAVLNSVVPQSSSDWLQDRNNIEFRRHLKTHIVWIAIACAIPPISFIAGPIGVIWWRFNRTAFAGLPSLHKALLPIALVVVGIQFLVLFLVFIITKTIS